MRVKNSKQIAPLGVMFVCVCVNELMKSASTSKTKARNVPVNLPFWFVCVARALAFFTHCHSLVFTVCVLHALLCAARA